MDCRMKPRAKLVTAMTALLLLAIPLAAVAAPNYRERYKCYEPGSTARTDTRARIETLPEIASPISISASLSAGPVVITRACDYVMIAIE